MDSSSIQLADSEIDSIREDDGSVRIHFSRAYIVKTMTGSAEKTLWWQAGYLVFDGAELDGPMPETPAVCDGGDVDDNVYTYRDMIPIPLQSRGRVGCRLRIRDAAAGVSVTAEAVRLELSDTPKYIRHIRD